MLSSLQNTGSDIEAEAFGLPAHSSTRAVFTDVDTDSHLDCSTSASLRDELPLQLPGQLYINVTVAGVLSTAVPVTVTPQWDLVNGQLQSVMQGAASPGGGSGLYKTLLQPVHGKRTACRLGGEAVVGF